MQLLRRIADEGDRAVLVVSHDERIREVADRVLWLEDGRLRAIGKLVRDPVCGMSVEVERAVIVRARGPNVPLLFARVWLGVPVRPERSSGCRADARQLRETT